MKYRADVMFDSGLDEEGLAQWLEDVLYAASVGTADIPHSIVMDLSVYEVCWMPGYSQLDDVPIRIDRSAEDPT